jgi:hypothetical protein
MMHEMTRARTLHPMNSSRQFTPNAEMPLVGGRLLTILGVTYVSLRTAEGGDLFLTRFGLQVHELLQIENWFEPRWFKEHRRQLEGTSTVFHVPSREVNGRSIELVVKNCRVGEDVPLDTHTVQQALGAEFNSPWEEFSLVMEMREGAFGPRDYAVSTQRPLAIYVPPECMQLWQTGRSRAKINSILARHPGIDLDILRQYKLVYQWIPGKNVIELLKRSGLHGTPCERISSIANDHATQDLAAKGYWVADMKPQHIIVSDSDLSLTFREGAPMDESTAERRVKSLLSEHRYCIIDYELLVRTDEHEHQVRTSRRRNYLDELTHCQSPSELPPNLSSMTLFGTRYVSGPVESTGGQLWVIGQNPRLFDYFLPERWRKTALWRIAQETELSYTVTKDGLNLLWRPSRVGESVKTAREASEARDPRYLSPFEVFTVLRELIDAKVPVVAPRAIYRTGTAKTESSDDLRAYALHAGMNDDDGTPVLREDRNYLMIFGIYSWVDDDVPPKGDYIPRPVGLANARSFGLVSELEALSSVCHLQEQVRRAGFDPSVITTDDLLVTLDDHDRVLMAEPGLPYARVHNVERFIRRS